MGEVQLAGIATALMLSGLVGRGLMDLAGVSFRRNAGAPPRLTSALGFFMIHPTIASDGSSRLIAHFGIDPEGHTLEGHRVLA